MKVLLQNIKAISIFFYCILCGTPLLYSQQGPGSAGGMLTGPGGSATFSVGQVDYIEANGPGGSTNPSIQQPYEIVIIKGISEKNIHLTISTYPNPTTDFVTLKVDRFNVDNFTYQLYDLQGKLLSEEKLKNKETSISLSELANATYFIRVLDNSKEIKYFKIIKNK